MQDPKLWNHMHQAPTFYCGTVGDEDHNPASIFASSAHCIVICRGMVKERVLMVMAQEKRSLRCTAPRIGVARI
ncbi:MAG: hypothetical protein CMP47_13910 [Rickettsiales bacterium]|nr:hypothetical protein [Rickettsiales bacterium]